MAEELFDTDSNLPTSSEVVFDSSDELGEFFAGYQEGII